MRQCVGTKRKLIQLAGTHSVQLAFRLVTTSVVYFLVTNSHPSPRPHAPWTHASARTRRIGRAGGGEVGGWAGYEQSGGGCVKHTDSVEHWEVQKWHVDELIEEHLPCGRSGCPCRQERLKYLAIENVLSEAHPGATEDGERSSAMEIDLVQATLLERSLYHDMRGEESIRDGKPLKMATQHGHEYHTGLPMRRCTFTCTMISAPPVLIVALAQANSSGLRFNAALTGANISSPVPHTCPHAEL